MRLFLAATLMVLGVSAWAQQRVTGTVSDAAGEPLIGVSIVEKGTQNGAITDLDGNFEIVVGNEAVLVISCIGFATQELTPSPSMQIVLKEDADFLDEVVVVGYGVQKKKSSQMNYIYQEIIRLYLLPFLKMIA